MNKFNKNNRIKRLEWAIYDVLGFYPKWKTMQKWVRIGIHGVKLETCSQGVYRATTDEVVSFVYQVNDFQPPAEAYDLDRRYLPRKASILCEKALGRRVSPSTITGWSKQGRRGVRLRTFSLGRFLLVTPLDLDAFLRATGLVPELHPSETAGELQSASTVD